MRTRRSARSWTTANSVTRRARKKHDRKKKGPGLKEIKLRPKTEDHDLVYKVKRLKEFLAESHKVKVTVMFRGREITHPEQARMLLDRLVALVGDDGQVEQPARFEGRNMIMLMIPKKLTWTASSGSACSADLGLQR